MVVITISLVPKPGLGVPDKWVNAYRLPPAIFAGLAMCYFIGRIDSRLLNVPRSLIGALYVYAVIQLAWPMIEPNPGEREFFPPEVVQLFLVAAIAGKIVLWRTVDSLQGS